MIKVGDISLGKIVEWIKKVVGDVFKLVHSVSSALCLQICTANREDVES